MNAFLRSFVLVGLGALTFSSVSCVMGTSVPKAEKEAVRAYTPPAGKALIYIYRPYSFYSSALAKGVWVNRQKVGSNGAGTFIAVPSAPGAYLPVLQASLDAAGAGVEIRPKLSLVVLVRTP